MTFHNLYAPQEVSWFTTLNQFKNEQAYSILFIGRYTSIQVLEALGSAYYNTIIVIIRPLANIYHNSKLNTYYKNCLFLKNVKIHYLNNIIFMSSEQQTESIRELANFHRTQNITFKVHLNKTCAFIHCF